MPVAAVLHYNVFSRLVTAISNRMFGIPLVRFFDDFVALVSLLLASKALGAFSRFFALLGIQTILQKSEVGPEISPV